MSDLNTERFLFTEPMFVHTNVYPNAESMKPILTNIIQEQGDQQKYETNVKAQMTTWDMYKNEYFKQLYFSIFFSETDSFSSVFGAVLRAKIS